MATTHLNILIRKGHGAAVVTVRYKYSALTDAEASRVVQAADHYYPEAFDRLGRLGAFGCQYPADQIEAAVAALRAEYGDDLPVQSNIPDNVLDRPLDIEGVVTDSARSAR